MNSISKFLSLTGLVAMVALILPAQAQEKAKAAGPTPAMKPASAKAAAPAAAEPKYKGNQKGPADAPIKVIEFADFMCPGCRAASGALREYLVQHGDVNLTFKNFPLEKSCNPGLGQTIHQGACELAMGAICAADLGAFWPYHDRIFSRAWEYATRQDVLDNGVAAGMDKTKLEACLNSADAKSKLALQVKEGFETGVERTPTLVVNGKKLNEPSEFTNTVEAERQKTAPAAPAPKK
jgi:protein-disulfide isomerase